MPTPAEYARELDRILFSLGSLTAEAEAGMFDLLDTARADIQNQLAALDLESPSRALLNRAREGIDDTTRNLAESMGRTVNDLQAEGHALGVDLALDPLGPDITVLAAAVTQDQLQIAQAFSADLIQDLAGDTRRRINAELASVVVGAKSPHAAALAIGRNLTSPNHFSTIAHRARAIVVTEVGRAQALGTQGAQQALQRSFDDAGDPRVVKKRWINAHLPGARATHLEAERNYAADATPGPIPIDDAYQIAGFAALYPKDPSLPPRESVHCHCVSITVIDEDSTLAGDEDGARDRYGKGLAKRPDPPPRSKGPEPYTTTPRMRRMGIAPPRTNFTGLTPATAKTMQGTLDKLDAAHPRAATTVARVSSADDALDRALVIEYIDRKQQLPTPAPLKAAYAEAKTHLEAGGSVWKAGLFDDAMAVTVPVAPGRQAILLKKDYGNWDLPDDAHPLTANRAEATLIHEYGHVVHNDLNALGNRTPLPFVLDSIPPNAINNTGNFNGVISRFEQGIPETTVYSQSNTMERAAESFTRHFAGDTGGGEWGQMLSDAKVADTWADSIETGIGEAADAAYNSGIDILREMHAHY